MAEVKPPEPSSANTTNKGGIIGGVILGLVFGTVLSIVGFLALAFGPSNVPCRQAYGEGAVLLVLSLLFAALAWYMLFRNKSRSAGAGFLRGVSIAALVVLLLPWPCSYTIVTYSHLGSCVH